MPMTFKQFFHLISYLQYPLMAVVLFFAFKPYVNGLEAIKQDPSIYFESLNTRIFILAIILMITFILGAGLIGFFSTKEKAINNVSVGLIVLGLSMFGFLKAGVEMFENHRLDKKVANKSERR